MLHWMHTNVILGVIQHKNKVLLLLKRLVDDSVLNISNPRMPLEIFISNSTIKIYTNCLLVFLSGKTLNITVPFTFLIKVLFIYFFGHICKVSCASSCSENDWSSVSGLFAHTCTSPYWWQLRIGVVHFHFGSV